MIFDRFLFTGDSFRTVRGEPAQIGNVKWLQRTIGPMLAQLTDLPQQIAFPLTGGDPLSWLALQGDYEPCLDTWAQLFWAAPSSRLVQALIRACAGALVISIEMPPILQQALEQADVPWIDIGISPLRFLPDWALHFRASHHFDLEKVRPFGLSPVEIGAAVDHVSRWYQPPSCVEPTLVFFAQTERDRTVILGDTFLGPDNAIEAVRAVRNGRRLLVKPHPWQPRTNVIEALLAEPGAALTDANTYSLLSAPEVDAITLSSSAGREAVAFGRPAVIISPSVQDWSYSGIDVLHAAASPRLWGLLLTSAGVAVGSAAEPPWRPNALRETIGGQGLDLAVWA